jgi:hypothetical protein
MSVERFFVLWEVGPSAGRQAGGNLHPITSPTSSCGLPVWPAWCQIVHQFVQQLYNRTTCQWLGSVWGLLLTSLGCC